MILYSRNVTQPKVAVNNVLYNLNIMIHTLVYIYIYIGLNITVVNCEGDHSKSNLCCRTNAVWQQYYKLMEAGANYTSVSLFAKFRVAASSCKVLSVQLNQRLNLKNKIFKVLHVM